MGLLIELNNKKLSSSEQSVAMHTLLGYILCYFVTVSGVSPNLTRSSKNGVVFKLEVGFPSCGKSLRCGGTLRCGSISAVCAYKYQMKGTKFDLRMCELQSLFPYFLAARKTYLKDELLMKVGAACYESNTGPIIKLVNFIASHYFDECLTVILYDDFFSKSLSFQPVIMELLRTFPGSMIHGKFVGESSGGNLEARALFLQRETICMNYVVLTQTLEPVAELLGYQPHSKVVVIPQSSRWQINSFLESPTSNLIVNLLIVADPSLQLDLFGNVDMVKLDINMFTHVLYADTMGTSESRLLTAWRCGRLTRPEVDLFPPKMMSLNGYQMQVIATEQPPYVYQKHQLDSAGDEESHWDGLEVRLLKLISWQLNLTMNFQQPLKQSSENTAENVLAELSKNRVDMAIAGVFLTKKRLQEYQVSTVHSQDCAVFMTLASTALPKYRAIMGPFHWEVWMLVTLAYVFAILPISFSVHHTLRILLDNPYEIENMFWYVFGTFTNCFTFSGKKSWSNGKMASTRMYIGTFWAFSIIISAAYSGSIIAFIMLPVFPEVIETPHQLVEEDYKLIVTNNSGLKKSIYNSTDLTIQELSHDLKVVDSIDEAISNVTKPKFFTNYAFLHSREFLRHIISTNFTKRFSHKKTVFHLSKTCFMPLLVTMMFPKNSVLVKRIDKLLLRAYQGGFVNKLKADVAWDQQKSSTGRLLQVSGGAGGFKSRGAEDRQLTLDDTQGIFLLMGAGFAIAASAFVTECLVFWWKKYKNRHHDSRTKSPSVASQEEKPVRSNRHSFAAIDHFWQYFGSLIHHSFFEADVQVHAENTPETVNGISKSFADIQMKDDHSANKRRLSF